MLSAKNRYQLLGTLCANLICVAYGAVCGWPSAAFPVLGSKDSPLASGPMTLDALSWVGSFMCIGSIFGTVYFGWASDKFGRKNSLIQSAIPNLIGWAIMYIAQAPLHLNVSRFLLGFSGAGSFVVIPVYVSEIADVKIRGALGSLMIFTCNIGILISFVFGYFVQLTTLPLIYITFPIIFLAVFIFFPETPMFLIKKGRLEEAEKSLQFYRNVSDNTGDESSGPMLKNEMQEMQKMFQPETQSKDDAFNMWDEINGRHGRRSLIMSLTLVTISQMCGLFVMINYTDVIFKASGSKMDSNEAAILMGALQIFGAYTATLLVDRTGRKFLLLASCCGTCVSLVVLAIFMYLLDNKYDVDSYSWVPIASFAGAIFLGNCGLLALPFLIISEILPEKIRAFGSFSAMLFMYVIGFVLLKGFPPFFELAGMSVSILVFAACSLLGGIYVLVVLPETKGKSFDDIKRIIEK